ncbi:uroporphyrinogen-III synthase [Viridibacillus sp. YIM B01967]|uniref:Uroporphyrinogen-III synthase n=1 Tax=Viridibacillus soli TaxID=2798301 RepID=A0ABS1H325_9BACL|nr:uroporphyrinogen-III synthase [Viridibacillus soli]MBK3493458.1 uroporphyrinogen-III synthase [Viridibacillus soli]
MLTDLPLSGDKIVLTGTHITASVKKQIEQLGGQAIHLPLITVHEIENDMDREQLEKSQQYDWLIFTSQNAVLAFTHKIQRFHFQASDWSCKVAAVGTKTAEVLEAIGFDIDFMPTIFSADVFVQEFPAVAGDRVTCQFFKGSMAKDTIVKGLSCHVDEWTVYETVQTMEHTAELLTLLKESTNVSVAFASPSAVDVFAKHIAKTIGWQSFLVLAIGHITEQALLQVGAKADVMPTTYTMKALIQELANRKEHLK